MICSVSASAWNIIRSTDNAVYLGFYRLLITHSISPVLDTESKISIFFLISGTAASVFLFAFYVSERSKKTVLLPLIFMSWLLILCQTGLILSACYVIGTGQRSHIALLTDKAVLNGAAGLMKDPRLWGLSAALLLITAAITFLYLKSLNKGPQSMFITKLIPLVLCLTAVAATVFSLTMITRNLSGLFELQQEISSVTKLISEQKTVIHACGEYDGYTYTNSLEALTNAYGNGNRVIEIDFNLTSDGRLIAGHESGPDQWVSGIDSADPLTEEEFLNTRYPGGLTTMGLEDLAEFMRRHEDLYVVTDIKGDGLGNDNGCPLIAQTCPDLLDRFIIQIYHISEYPLIRSLGFKNMIFTLYATSEDERRPEVLLQDLNDCDLIGLTLWEDWADDGFINSLRPADTAIFVHTVNDTDDILYEIGRGLFVYTDNVDNSSIRDSEVI